MSTGHVPSFHARNFQFYGLTAEQSDHPLNRTNEFKFVRAPAFFGKVIEVKMPRSPSGRIDFVSTPTLFSSHRYTLPRRAP